MIREVFTTSGSWTCPDGITEITVECWGGGGAGSDGYSTTAAGCGGGGGAYAKKICSVIPGNTYSFTVGIGGRYNAIVSGLREAGGDSQFNSNEVLAKGGGGGNSSIAGVGANAINCIGDICYSGGNGGAKYNNANGTSGGGGAGTTQNGFNGGSGSSGSLIGGAGGFEYGGRGGNVVKESNGENGQPYGGGGAGSERSSGHPGSGGTGAVIISYEEPVLNNSAFLALLV